jgi:RecJ-like exonuclease
MKCSECNGRGHFLMLMSTPQCDVCAGTGEAPAAAITSPGAPREFRDLSIGYAPESALDRLTYDALAALWVRS